MASSNGTNSMVSGDITPEEVSRLQTSVRGKEQAPTSKDQAAAFVDWAKVASALGQPHDVERIPISKLRQMRRDPMLGFGISFITTPAIRAPFYFESPDAQVAAFVDACYRRIHASYMLQRILALSFGFQAKAKRFELWTPDGTYIQRGENAQPQNPSTNGATPATGAVTGGTEVPIWSEGNVQPVAWKTFTPLMPEYVTPIWNSAGEFDGIEYKPPGTGNAKGKTFKIDIYHSLWATNEKESVFGSPYGYPRLGYAYRYWWTYWFRWAIADRAFEKKGDPSTVVRHPVGQHEAADGGLRQNWELALEIGERLRAGSTVAMPSTPYERFDGSPGQLPEWDITELDLSSVKSDLDSSFDYLDIMKLRSLWIPEQAFLEGKGGTSSRNVATQQSDNFIDQQAVLMAQIDLEINQYMIPQLVLTNFPEKTQPNGKPIPCKKVTRGFGSEDIEFTKQIIQLIGQANPGELETYVDVMKALEGTGAPIRSLADQQAKQQEIAARAAAAAPPAVAPTTTTAGVVPTGTGFSYIEPVSRIELADRASTEFLENLPGTHHYTDKTVRALARQLWNVWREAYRAEYMSLADAIESGELELSDDEQVPALEMVDIPRAVARRANAVVNRWKGSAEKFGSALERTRDIGERIFRRAATVELSRVRRRSQVPDTIINAWIEGHLDVVATQVAQTVQDEARIFLASQLAEGVEDTHELAQAVRVHFDEWPGWKATRLVRTEVRDIYNEATLVAAEYSGFSKVRAVDARKGPTDEDCMERNGQVMTLAEARAQEEHPNGTLGFRILASDTLSVRRVDAIVGAKPGTVGHYDPEHHELLLSQEASEADADRYLLTIREWLGAAA